MASKSEREKHEDDLRELQQRNVERRQAHAPAEVHSEVPSDGKGRGVEVHCFGGHCYVNSHGEAKFDQDALLTLIQKLQAAFQAVQV